MLERSHAGDAKQQRARLDFLERVRDRVLANALVGKGNVVLDVGAGDGLIGFGALDLIDSEGVVIFSDIWDDLLDHARSLADRMAALEHCRFVNSSADELTAIDDASVDVVTTRSVLIYLPFARKKEAFREFHRVLKPGGRFSLFEPINRFSYPEPDHLWWGFDVRAVADLAAG